MKVEDNKNNLNDAPTNEGAELLNEVIQTETNLSPKEAANELALNNPDVQVIDGNNINESISEEDLKRAQERMQQLHEMGIDPRTMRRYPKVPFVRSEAKVGRNEPCTCGSGKKYKKCCGS